MTQPTTEIIATLAAEEGQIVAGSEWSRRWSRFRRNRLAVGGGVFCIVLVLAAILAPWITPFPYDQTDYTQIMQPMFTNGHLLGTDQLGRDVFSRLVYSLRTALMISFGAELIALFLGLVVGLTAGYFGGKVDQLLMAGTDIMYAFPGYLFAVILVTVMGRSNLAVIIAIAVASWVGQARLIRSQVVKLKSFEYVEAGRALGAKHSTLVLRYILPGSWGPMLVATSFGIPGAIMTESGLSLLGLGVAPPQPSWGAMISEGYSQLLSHPQFMIAPVVLFVLTMMAFTWLGDGIRDAFDVNED